MGDWIELKLGEVAKIVIGGTPSRGIPEYWDNDFITTNHWVSIRDINKKIVDTTAERITKKGILHSNAKLISKGTVLMSFKLSIGKVAIAGAELFTNEAIAAFVDSTINKRFLYHGLHEWNLLQDVDQAVKGVTLNKQKLKRIKFIAPSSSNEQATIAHILDVIDEAIEKSEQLIAKYEHIKTGLMQDLLTRGIDENGNIRSEEKHEFKDSSVGKIPKKWKVESLGALANFISGKAWSTELLSRHGMKIIRISNLHKPDFPYWRYDKEYTEDMIVKKGDILFSWAGVASSIDCVQYLGEPALLNQHIYNLKFSNEAIKMFSHRYINWFLPSLRREIEGGAGQLHLTKGKIQSINIPIPEPIELKTINERFMYLEELIDREYNSLYNLSQQKKGLMQDLLTGKVRVDALMKQTAEIV